MATSWRVCGSALIFASSISVSQALEYCNGNYWCEHGHCCGHGRCCTYYYEVWWFWVIWSVIALITGCCFYQQKRLRLRRQRLYNVHPGSERRRSSRSSRRSSGAASQPASVAQNGVPVAGSVQPGIPAPPAASGTEKDLYLPTYEEIDNLPKDPPAYDVLYSHPVRAALPVVDPAQFGLSRANPSAGVTQAGLPHVGVAVGGPIGQIAGAQRVPHVYTPAASHNPAPPYTAGIVPTGVCPPYTEVNELPYGTASVPSESSPPSSHSEEQGPPAETGPHSIAQSEPLEPQLSDNPTGQYSAQVTIDDSPDAQLLDNEETSGDFH